MVSIIIQRCGKSIFRKYQALKNSGMFLLAALTMSLRKNKEITKRTETIKLETLILNGGLIS